MGSRGKAADDGTGQGEAPGIGRRRLVKSAMLGGTVLGLSGGVAAAIFTGGPTATATGLSGVTVRPGAGQGGPLATIAASVRPEGGGSQYGPDSGGFDQLGFGTLAYTL